MRVHNWSRFSRQTAWWDAADAALLHQKTLRLYAVIMEEKFYSGAPLLSGSVRTHPSLALNVVELRQLQFAGVRRRPSLSVTFRFCQLYPTSETLASITSGVLPNQIGFPRDETVSTCLTTYSQSHPLPSPCPSPRTSSPSSYLHHHLTFLPINCLPPNQPHPSTSARLLPQPGFPIALPPKPYLMNHSQKTDAVLRSRTV